MGGAVVCIPLEIKSDYKIFKGGNQENNLRAGTENTPAILCIKDASVLQLSTLEEKNSRLVGFKTSIENNLKEKGGIIIAENSNRLPSTTFVILPTEDIDFILMGLEEKGIIVSTGSSCKSRARDASPSLLSMGYSKEEALRAIRISTGIFTTEEEIEILNLELNKLLVNFC
jgi:cysteine desulfurase